MTGGGLRQTGVVLAAWLGFAALTEHWRPWGDGVRLRYAGDVTAFERIARAAPGLPKQRIGVAHSDRFVPHWVVGAIAHLLGVGIHLAYQVGTGALLVGTLLTLVATLRALRVSPATQAVCVGALVASAYPFRYLAVSPGMITDAVFVFGLAVTVHGFVTRRSPWIVVGLAVATLGQQTALALAVLAGAILLARRAWIAAACSLVLSAVAYVVPHELSAGWADTSDRGIFGISVLDARVPAGEVVSYAGRGLVAVAIPLGLLALGWWRGRMRPALVPLALGLATLAGAVVLSPGWAHTQTRLAGLAAPALIAAAAPAVDAAALTALAAATVCLGIALASFHHLYSRVSPDGARGWAGFVALGTALVLLPAVRRAPAERAVDRASFFASALRYAPFLSASVGGAVYAIPTDDRGVGRRLFVTRGRPEFTVLQRVVALLGKPPPGSTIVDVGANIGTTTIPALVEHGFERAVACEPGPSALRMLRVGIAANGLESRVDIVGAAISNKDGTVTFDTETSSFGTHRISNRAIGVSVEALTLDTLVACSGIDPAHVALLWLDVQGHEGYVLDGARALLDAQVATALALRRDKLVDADGLDLLLDILEARFAHVVDLRGDAEWQPDVEPIGAVRRYLDEERATDILVLP